MQNNIIFGENSRIIDTSVIELEILKKTKKKTIKKTRGNKCKEKRKKCGGKIL